jgi:hypothetical protein
MAIKFVTKSQQEVQVIEKQRLTLLDAIRVMSWEQHKLDNPNYKRGLEGYNTEFGDEWKIDPIHDKSLDELIEFIQDLGFTVDELLSVRSEHYSEKKLIQERVAAKKAREFGYETSQTNGFKESEDGFKESEDGDDEYGYPPY